MSQLANYQDPETGNVIAQTDAIFNVIERAARDPNVDMDKFERLMAMQEKIAERNAKASYAAAFAEMQGALPEVEERGKGHGNITYAKWEDVNDAIRPVLSQYGFGLSFRVGRASSMITVTGVLSHRDGHSEETMIELPADTSGSKNAVQAVGSTTTYGKRYTATALLNLTSRLAEDKDDNGAASGRGETISDDQRKTLLGLISDTETDIEAFCRHMKIEALPEMRAADFDRAVSALNRKKKGRTNG